MNIVSIIVSMLGGLALFLYGMRVMSETLSQMTGGSLDRVIGKITKNRYIGFAAGALLTALVQTSSATTVLTVGFVNAGIMKLREAFGLIVGANLGATGNAWILSLNSVEGGTPLLELCKPSFFVPVIAFIAIILLSLSKSETGKNIATALIGFCVMMTGMMLMSNAIGPLKEIPAFQSMLTSFSNPFIAFLAALLFTMVIQSSDATVGILQAIAMSAILTRGMAIPLVCGAQVGTCMTALLSSLGTSNNGRRTALLHLYFNLFKTIPFLVILFVIDGISHISGLDKTATGMWIPLFHTSINIVAAIIYLPLSGLFVKLTEITIPYNSKEKQDQENVLTMLDQRLLMNPAVAVGQVRNALLKMSETVSEAYALLLDKSKTGIEVTEDITVICERIMQYKDQILRYLVEISERNIDEDTSAKVQCEQNIGVSFGRIGELILSTMNIRNEMISNGRSFSAEGNKDIYILTEAVREIVDTTMLDFEFGNRSLTESIGLFREVVSELHGEINSRHIKRFHDGICDRASGMPFMDICYNLEKIIDSCDMVADNLLRYINRGQGRAAGNSDISDEKRAEYIRNLYKDKYLELLR